MEEPLWYSSEVDGLELFTMQCWCIDSSDWLAGLWAARGESCDLIFIMCTNKYRHTRRQAGKGYAHRLNKRNSNEGADVILKAQCFLINETVVVRWRGLILGYRHATGHIKLCHLSTSPQMSSTQCMSTAPSHVYPAIDPHMNFMCVADSQAFPAHACQGASLFKHSARIRLYVCTPPICRPSVPFWISDKPRDLNMWSFFLAGRVGWLQKLI